MIEVGARELRLARYGRGLRPSLRASASAPLAGSESIGQALESVLARADAARGAHARIVVSAEWIRFALTQGASALRGPMELQAAAAHTLGHVYGDAAAAWRVCAGRSGDDTLLAAGIDPGLLGAMTAVLGERGMQATSCTPLFVAALNHLRRALAGPAWIAVVEPTRAVLAFVDREGALRALRAHRVDAASTIALEHWLDQCRLQDGIDADGATIVVASCGGPEIDAAGVARFVDLSDPVAAWPRAS